MPPGAGRLPFNARPFLDLDAGEQNQKFRARLKDFCQKAYKKTHVTKQERRLASSGGGDLKEMSPIRVAPKELQLEGRHAA